MPLFLMELIAIQAVPVANPRWRAKKKNIYYQKRIHDSGKDSFMLNARTFLVTWKCDEKDARTHLVSDHYAVNIRELFPLITDEAPAN